MSNTMHLYVNVTHSWTLMFHILTLNTLRWDIFPLKSLFDTSLLILNRQDVLLAPWSILSTKGIHIKLPFTPCIVHVANFTKHGPFLPSLVMDSNDRPHTACKQKPLLQCNRGKYLLLFCSPQHFLPLLGVSVWLILNVISIIFPRRKLKLVKVFPPSKCLEINFQLTYS